LFSFCRQFSLQLFFQFIHSGLEGVTIFRTVTFDDVKLFDAESVVEINFDKNFISSSGNVIL
jgi:hypothetical protein